MTQQQHDIELDVTSEFAELANDAEQAAAEVAEFAENFSEEFAEEVADEEPQQKRLHVDGITRQKLAIRIHELLTASDQFPDTEEGNAEFNRRFEILSDMLAGKRPYEEIKFAKVRIRGEKKSKILIKFFSEATEAREAKWALAYGFDMLNLPQAKIDKDYPGLRRFTVYGITRPMAREVMKNNPGLFKFFKVFNEDVAEVKEERPEEK